MKRSGANELSEHATSLRGVITLGIESGIYPDWLLRRFPHDIADHGGARPVGDDVFAFSAQSVPGLEGSRGARPQGRRRRGASGCCLGIRLCHDMGDAVGGGSHDDVIGRPEQ